MKLRLCSPQLGLSPTSILGGEIYDCEVLKGLAKSGIEVEILLPQNHPYDKSIKNWRVQFLPFTHIPALLFNFLEIPYLFSTYRHRPFHILRLHAPYFTGIGAWFFRLFYPHIKLVATYHQARSGFPFDLINHLFIHSWDAIITDSEAARDRLAQKYHVPASKITVIPGGAPDDLKPINFKRSLLSRRLLKISQKDVVLLFMGLFIFRKNPLFILEVVKKLCQTHPHIKLIICGHGPLEKDIRHRIQKHKLTQHVIVHPPVFGTDKQKLYNLADIFVHPALHEGLPLVVLEAMVCGLPIVISKGYSAGELVTNGHNGFIVTANDAQEWARKIYRLIKDPLIRKTMGKASRRKVMTRFTWAKAVQQHLTVFHRLIQS